MSIPPINKVLTSAYNEAVFSTVWHKYLSSSTLSHKAKEVKYDLFSPLARLFIRLSEARITTPSRHSTMDSPIRDFFRSENYIFPA